MSPASPIMAGAKESKCFSNLIGPRLSENNLLLFFSKDRVFFIITIFQITYRKCWQVSIISVNTLFGIQMGMLFCRIIMWAWLEMPFLLCPPMIHTAINLKIFAARPFFCNMQTHIHLHLDSLLQKSVLTLSIQDNKCYTMTFSKGTIMRISKMCAWRLGTQASLHYLWVWDAKFASRICKGCCAKKFGYITYIFFQKCHIIISQLTDLAISKANSNFLAKI